jgi:hypothetical protein
MVNAITVAHDVAVGGLVEAVAQAIRPDGPSDGPTDAD